MASLNGADPSSRQSARGYWCIKPIHDVIALNSASLSARFQTTPSFNCKAAVRLASSAPG
ncbi:hypothetical protein Q7L65_17090 [Conexibacter sp. CPCC 206217]|nr:hypothetical protein [Conexibacter sp. CPCC 206217]